MVAVVTSMLLVSMLPLAPAGAQDRDAPKTGACVSGPSKPLKLDLSVTLEGSYDPATKLMDDALRVRGLLPQVDPYFARAFVDTDVFETTGRNAIVDWVVVELRNGNLQSSGVPADWAVQVPALVQRDGDIVGLDGASTVTVMATQGTTYTPVVRHRSHGLVSFAPLTHEDSAGYQGLTQAMLVGDANGDSDINGDDKVIWSEVNGRFGVYHPADFTMDASIDGADKVAWSKNNGMFFLQAGTERCAPAPASTQQVHPIFASVDPDGDAKESEILALAAEAFPQGPDDSTEIIAAADPGLPSLTEGAIRGSFDVSAQGAATYRVPFFAPPGAGGSKPDVGLVYDSQSGNDVAGVGWAIYGLSQITRCPATPFLDGYNGSVQHNPDDRFCLNGTRLVAVNGTYGADGTTYRTDPETYVRVISHGAAGSGPAWFTVEDGSGKTTWFGGDATNSIGRIEAQGKDEVRVWASSKVVDLAGNYMSYSYLEDNAAGSFAIEHIDYTGNATAPPTNRITFVWQNRSDNELRFQGGSMIRVDRLLDRVETSADGGATIAMSYDLDYRDPFWVNPGPSPFNPDPQPPLLWAFDRALLGSITQCDGNNVCMESTKFRWDREGAAFKDVVPVAGAPTDISEDAATAHADLNRVKIGDFNGDGRSDVYHVAGWNGPANDYLYFGQPNGALSAVGIETNMPTYVGGTAETAAGSIAQIQVGDFNCDGRDDLYLVNGSSSTPEQDWIHYSNGDGTFTAGVAGPSTVLSAASAEKPGDISLIHLNDFNNDGCTDVYVQGGPSVDDQLWLSETGGGFSTSINVGQPVSSGAAAWASLGTGLSALTAFTSVTLAGKPNEHAFTGAHRKFVSVTAAKNRPRFGKAASGANAQAIKFGDFNGDGYLDRYAINGGGPGLPTMDQISFGNGTGFDPAFDAIDTLLNPTLDPLDPLPSASLLAGWAATALARVQVYDANGDGLTDVHVLPNTYDPIETGYYVDNEFVATGFDMEEQVYLSRGDGTFHAVGSLDYFTEDQSPQSVSSRFAKTVFVDLNSDGQADRYQMTDNNDPISPIEQLSFNYNDRIGYGKPFGSVNELQPVGPRSPLAILPGAQQEAWEAHTLRIHSHRFGDFDGDGMADLYYIGSRNTAVNGRDEIFVNRNRPGRIIEIVDGHNNQTTIRYAELSADDAVYGGHTSTAGHLDSTRNHRSAVSVVAAYSLSDPLGGEYPETTFVYAGAKMNPDLGYLGFNSVIETNTAASRSTTTVFNQIYPFDGLVDQQIVRQNGVIIQETTHTHEAAGASVRPLTSITTESDLDGQSTRVEILELVEYDDFNTPVDQTFSFSDGDTTTHSIRTTSVVNNDTTRWILGQLGTVTRTTSSPFVADQTTETVFTYGSNDLPATKTISTNGEHVDGIAYTYDQFGNVTSETQIFDAGTQRLLHQADFSADGRFQTILSNAVGHQSTFTHDPHTGNVTTETDPNGLTSSTTYDGFGRTVREVGTDGSTVYRFYEDDEQIYVTTPPSGTVSQVSIIRPGLPGEMVFLDARGRELRKVTPGINPDELIFVDTRYDVLSRVSATSLPYFEGETPRWTTFTFDGLGRVVETETPDGAITQTQYFGSVPSSELQGNPLFGAYPGLTKTVTINDLGQRTTTYRDAQDLVVQVLNDQNFEISYLHDTAGRVIGIADADGNVSSFDFDDRGNLVAHDDPDFGLITSEYNEFNELISMSDASGSTTSYGYDAIGRTVMIADSDGTTTYNYDVGTSSIGQLTSVAHPGGLEEYQYDEFGRLISTQTTIGSETWTESLAYDEFGRQTFRIEPHRTSDPFTAWLYTWNSYSSSGHLKEVRNFPVSADEPYQVFWKVDETTASLQPTSVELAGSGSLGPSPIPVTRSYDPATNRLTGLAVGDNGTVLNESYGYDTLGNLVSRTDALNPNKFETFGYDSLNRLVATTTRDGLGTTRTDAYGYDSLGNIYSRSDVAPGTVYQYGQNGAGPHAVTQVGSSQYTYDANGNMISGPDRTLAWDASQNLSSVTTADGTTTFGYDHADRLVRRVDTAGTTHLNIGRMEARTAAGEETEFRYSLLAGEDRIAMNTFVVDANGFKVDIETTYIVGDHLGSTSLTLDASGTVLSNLSYDAFGNRRNADWTLGQAPVPDETDYGFSGHRQLDDLGLIDMNARLYDPLLGRFISPDSIIPDQFDLQSLNRYSYVNNNPLSYIDPTGHCAQDPGSSAIGCMNSSTPDGEFDGSLPSIPLPLVESTPEVDSGIDDDGVLPPFLWSSRAALAWWTGQPRHLTSVDAVSLELNLTVTTPFFLTTSTTPVAGVLMLAGPDEGLFFPFTAGGGGISSSPGAGADGAAMAYFYSGPEADFSYHDDWGGQGYSASIEVATSPFVAFGLATSYAEVDEDRMLVGVGLSLGPNAEIGKIIPSSPSFSLTTSYTVTSLTKPFRVYTPDRSQRSWFEW